MKRRPPRSTRTDTLFPYTTLFRPFGGNRSDDWRYDQGFAYRIDPATGLVRGIVPLLGGALFSGNTWPQSFTDYRVSPYYRSEEHTSELQSLMRISYAVFCLKKKKINNKQSS